MGHRGDGGHRGGGGYGDGGYGGGGYGGGGYGCCGINLMICFCCQGNTLVLEVWAVSLDLRYHT